MRRLFHIHSRAYEPVGTVQEQDFASQYKGRNARYCTGIAPALAIVLLEGRSLVVGDVEYAAINFNRADLIWAS